MFYLFAIILYMSSLLVSCGEGAFRDVTDNALSNPEKSRQGLLAAFGDFNSDKLTDIFMQPDNSSISVFFAKNEKNFVKLKMLRSKLNIVLQDLMIHNIYPSDFNGDSKMDLMLFCTNITDKKNIANIYFGDFTNYSSNKTLLNLDMKDQPLLFDFNGDSMPDLLADDSKGVRSVWVFTDNDGKLDIKKQLFSQEQNLLELWKPTSSAFVDINSDLVSDIVIVSRASDNKPVFEHWLNNNGHYIMDGNHTLDTDARVFGNSLYIDINGKGHIDHVLHVCMDDQCEKSAIYQYSFTEKLWYTLAASSASFKGSSKIQWGFSPGNVSDHLSSASMTLRGGDYNLDGFIDILCILQKKEGSRKEKRVFILENSPCNSADECNGTRSLTVQWELSEPFSAIQNPVVAAFYDLGDDGILDVIITDLVDNGYRTYIFKNMLTEDASFLKVLVTSGRCDANCDGKTPYGSSQPGPMVRYNTITYEGSEQVGCAAQLSQSAYFSLQLPYSIFGLARMPNFVEKLTIGIPSPKRQDAGITSRIRTWEQIIPNSQIVIIPNPLDDPSGWVEKLFAAPSHLVVATAGTLIATCVFISLIIGILHWREKREDRREKLEEAQHFHFDAM